MTREDLITRLKEEREAMIEEIIEHCTEICDTVKDYGEEDIEDLIDGERETLEYMGDMYDGYVARRVAEFEKSADELIDEYNIEDGGEE